MLTEGFLSFFSPCVLPILPVYMAYLSQDALKKDLTGWRKRLHIFGFTLAFVLGICTVFFIAAMSAKGISGWLNENRLLIFTLLVQILCILLRRNAKLLLEVADKSGRVRKACVQSHILDVHSKQCLQHSI